MNLPFSFFGQRRPRATTARCTAREASRARIARPARQIWELRPASKNRLRIRSARRLRHDEDLFRVRIFRLVSGLIAGHVDHPSVRIEAINVTRSARHWPGDRKLCGWGRGRRRGRPPRWSRRRLRCPRAGRSRRARSAVCRCDGRSARLRLRGWNGLRDVPGRRHVRRNRGRGGCRSRGSLVALIDPFADVSRRRVDHSKRRDRDLLGGAAADEKQAGKKDDPACAIHWRPCCSRFLRERQINPERRDKPGEK